MRGHWLGTSRGSDAGCSSVRVCGCIRGLSSSGISCGGGAPLRIMVGMVGVGRLGGLLISWGWGTLVHETVWGGVRGGTRFDGGGVGAGLVTLTRYVNGVVVVES